MVGLSQTIITQIKGGQIMRKVGDKFFAVENQLGDRYGNYDTFEEAYNGAIELDNYPPKEDLFIVEYQVDWAGRINYTRKEIKRFKLINRCGLYALEEVK